ncbi:MAG: hypothetical protein Q7T62_00480 [Undibacterium sp.]|nr:hypothetical protein [Undibacterium sp.]
MATLKRAGPSRNTHAPCRGGRPERRMGIALQGNHFFNKRDIDLAYTASIPQWHTAFSF